MKKAYLNKNGEVVLKSFKDLNTSWMAINSYYVDRMTKEENEFLKKYGLRPTIFNVSNLREIGHIYLTSVDFVLKCGAVDCRGVEE